MEHYVLTPEGFVPGDRLDWTNRGFLYGDGCFETCLWNGERINFWSQRVRRLDATFRFLGMQPAFSMKELGDCLYDVLPKRAKRRVRLTFFREGMGKYLPQQHGVGVVLQTEPEVAENASARTMTVGLGTVRLPSDEGGNFKLLAKHWQVKASMECADRGLDELILCNQKEVAECIKGNIFLSLEGALVTPPLTSGCLDGVVRAVLLQHPEVREQRLSIKELEQVRGGFMSNSVVGLVPFTWNGQSPEAEQLSALQDWLRSHDA